MLSDETFGALRNDEKTAYPMAWASQEGPEVKLCVLSCFIKKCFLAYGECVMGRLLK